MSVGGGNNPSCHRPNAFGANGANYHDEGGGGGEDEDKDEGEDKEKD